MIDYRNVIRAHRRKPMALLNLVYRDQLWPCDAYDDLAANWLPDLNVLREYFSPDLASLQGVSVHLTPLSATNR